MHVEALDFCYRAAQLIDPTTVVEFGARNVNGTARDAFPNTRWVGYDIEPGDGVLVHDCTQPLDIPQVDLGVSTEVLEHVDLSAAFLTNLVAVVRTGGWVLVTCATDGRAPHSAVDGGDLRAGEHYRNVKPFELERRALEPLMVEVHENRGDLFLLAKVVR